MRQTFLHNHNQLPQQLLHHPHYGCSLTIDLGLLCRFELGIDLGLGKLVHKIVHLCWLLDMP